MPSPDSKVATVRFLELLAKCVGGCLWDCFCCLVDVFGDDVGDFVGRQFEGMSKGGLGSVSGRVNSLFEAAFEGCWSIMFWFGILRV